jgi:hypothetical protein
MKKLFLLTLLYPAILHAQRWHVNVYGGISNYEGDLQNKVFTLDESYGAFGAGLQYDLTRHFSVLGNLSVAKVGASDALNKPSLQPRNLSFQSQILEANVLAEYTLFDLGLHRFSPYVFAGLAVFHFNPYAYDTLGNKIFLRPLSTEGEGLPEYPDRKPYSLTQLAIPFGGGIKLRVTDNVVLAYEVGFRKLFTDYLDDVSTTYVDESILLAAKGSEAVEMSYRGNELKGGNPTYPVEGTLRGGSKYKDWYYFSVIKISIGLNYKGNTPYGKGINGSIECPKKL